MIYLHKMHAFNRIPRAMAAAMPAALSSVAAMYYHGASADAAPSPLSPSEFRPFKLKKVTQLTHDTKRYTLEIPGDAGMKVASLVMLQVPVDGEKVCRAM